MSDDLQRLRAEIDRLDEEVLARLSRRAEIAPEIGRVKGGAGGYLSLLHLLRRRPTVSGRYLGSTYH